MIPSLESSYRAIDVRLEVMATRSREALRGGWIRFEYRKLDDNHVTPTGMGQIAN